MLLFVRRLCTSLTLETVQSSFFARRKAFCCQDYYPYFLRAVSLTGVKSRLSERQL